MNAFLKILGSLLAGCITFIVLTIIMSIMMSGYGEGMMALLPFFIIPIALFMGGAVTGFILSNCPGKTLSHLFKLTLFSPVIVPIPLICLSDIRTYGAIQSYDFYIFALWIFCSWIGSFVGWGLHSLLLKKWRVNTLVA